MGANSPSYWEAWVDATIQEFLEGLYEEHSKGVYSPEGAAQEAQILVKITRRSLDSLP
jgi:hypothetical protein